LLRIGIISSIGGERQRR